MVFEFLHIKSIWSDKHVARMLARLAIKSGIDLEKEEHLVHDIEAAIPARRGLEIDEKYPKLIEILDKVIGEFAAEMKDVEIIESRQLTALGEVRDSVLKWPDSSEKQEILTTLKKEGERLAAVIRAQLNMEDRVLHEGTEFHLTDEAIVTKDHNASSRKVRRTVLRAQKAFNSAVIDVRDGEEHPDQIVAKIKKDLNRLDKRLNDEVTWTIRNVKQLMILFGNVLEELKEAEKQVEDLAEKGYGEDLASQYKEKLEKLHQKIVHDLEEEESLARVLVAKKDHVV